MDANIIIPITVIAIISTYVTYQYFKWNREHGE